MSGYGFRLYKVKVVKGWGKSSAVQVNKVGMDQAHHAGSWVRRAITELEKYEALTQMPQQSVGEGEVIRPMAAHVCPGTQDDPRVSFVRHSATPITRIRFEFSFGHLGRVPLALGETAALNHDLRHHAAGHTYRGVFYFPTSGKAGVLALETIPNAPNPIDALNAWLARSAVDLADADAAHILALPESEREGLESIPYKLNFSQFVNYARLEKMIEETSDVELVLRKTSISEGSSKGSETVRLVSKIDTKAKRRSAVEVARELFRINSDEDEDEVAAMAELEGLAPGDVSALEFNDGYIKVDDGKNGVKKIGLGRMDRFFVYPLGPQRLTSTRWEQRVAAELVSMQGLLGVELDVS